MPPGSGGGTAPAGKRACRQPALRSSFGGDRVRGDPRAPSVSPPAALPGSRARCPFACRPRRTCRRAPATARSPPRARDPPGPPLAASGHAPAHRSSRSRRLHRVRLPRAPERPSRGGVPGPRPFPPRPPTCGVRPGKMAAPSPAPGLESRRGSRPAVAPPASAPPVLWPWERSWWNSLLPPAQIWGTRLTLDTGNSRN